MKRVVSILMSAVLFVSAMMLGEIPISATASTTDDGFSYYIYDDEITITDYQGEANELAIPSEIDGYPVTSIADMAFMECDQITNITVPQGVKTIGEYAFNFCERLETISLPQSLEAVAQYAFYNCGKLSEVNFNGTRSQWNSIYIDNSYDGNYCLLNADIFCVDDFRYFISNGEVTITDYIGTAAKIVIPSEFYGYPVTAIADMAFMECDQIINITVPQGVKTIGEYAFNFCQALETISLPQSLTNISQYAFYNCASLSRVYYNGKVSQWNDIYIDNSYNGNYCLLNSTILFVDEFIYSVSDGESAVAGYTGEETEVMIPSQIEGYPVTAVSDMAFMECDKITAVTVPQGVKTIGDYAFNFCESLETISLPQSLEAVSQYAFYNCGNLSEVYYQGTKSQWDRINIDNSYNGNYCLLNAKILFADEFIYYISNDEITIADYAGEATELTIPSQIEGYTVTCIGEGAFSDCDRLTALTISDSIISIEADAFLGCTALESVRFYSRAQKDRFAQLFGTAEITCMCQQQHSFAWGIYCDACEYTAKALAPSVSSVTDTAVILNEADGCEYSKDGINWQSSNVFEGLSSGAQYTFYQRYIKTDTHIAGEISDGINVTTKNIKLGDLSGDGIITDDDAVYLLFYTFFPEDYPVNQNCDFDSNGQVTDSDAVHLLFHTFFPEDYPLA